MANFATKVLQREHAAQGLARTDKEFAEMAYDLLDYEAQAVVDVSREVLPRYARRRYDSTRELATILSELEDEMKTRLAAIGILVTVNPFPMLEGKPPTVDIVGHTKDHSIHKHGFDHEQKEWEVKHATAEGKDYHGQKK
jgi:hypothetical protein